MPPPRILHVCHRYLPHLGGIEWYVHRLARDSAKKGSDVAVATSARSGVSGTKREGKVRVYYLRDSVVLPRNAWLLGLRGVVQQFRPTHVHIHSIWFFPSLQICWLKKSLGFKIVNTVHGVWPDEAGGTVRLFLRLFKPLAQFILHRSDTIIVLSESEKEKLQHYFHVDETKVTIIGNGVDLIQPRKSGLKLPRPYILFTGRIIPDKNPQLLVDAFARMATRYPQLHLVFLGTVTPTYKKELTKRAGEFSPRVMFYPPLDPRHEAGAIAAMYNQAEVSVAIGSWEGLPTRVLESLIQGAPVLGYASGGLRGIIKEGKNGYLISQLTVESLSQALATLAELSPSQMRRLRQNSLASMSAYRWDKQFNHIYDSYR